ncbi:MAG: NAD-dependent epimerase/dehydratase family protein [Rhodospirillales bacterium]
MSRTLVTGASGYVAGALLPLLEARGDTLLLAGRKPFKTPHPTLIGCPSEGAFWEKALAAGVTRVFHLAAQNSLYQAEQDPDADWRANVLPIVHLIRAAESAGRVVDVIYTGTATVVGLTDDLPVSETHPCRPVTVYDRDKLAAERHLAAAAEDGQLRATTLRLANVYGPGRGVVSPDRGILGKLARAALDGQTLKVFGGGDYLRDYVYIDDVASALLVVAENMDRCSGRAFFLASGQGHTLLEAFTRVAKAATTRTGKRVPVEPAPWPEGLSVIERRNFVADISALTAATGWEPTVDLATGIERTFDALMGQEAMI